MRSMTWLSPLAFLAACSGGDQTPTTQPTVIPTSTPSPTPTPSETPVPPPTNVVMFIIDDLAFEDANFEGDGEKVRFTPRIDEIASKSVVLTNFHVSSPICTPSRYSALTGNYASRATNRIFMERFIREGYTVPQFNTFITPQNKTIATSLKNLGYRTGFTGKNHVTEPNYYENIEINSSINDPGVASQLEIDRNNNVSYLNNIGFDEAYCIYPGQVYDIPVKELRNHNIDCITKGAIDFIDNNANKKFFLVDSLTVPHTPLEPSLSWNSNPLATAYGFLSAPLDVQPARSTLTPRVRAAGHDGEENFLWLDDAVGAVLDKLQSHGLMDKTMIVFMSDHGMRAKGSVYFGGSHTAAFVYYHGYQRRVNNLLSNVDIYNTVMDIAGGVQDGDGLSFRKILEGGNQTIHDYLYLELGYARAILKDNFEYIAMRHSPYIISATRFNKVPLTQWPYDNGINSLEAINMSKFQNYLAVDQLYNTLEDRDFHDNLFYLQASDARVTKMKKNLQDVINTLPGKFPVFN